MGVGGSDGIARERNHGMGDALTRFGIFCGILALGGWAVYGAFHLRDKNLEAYTPAMAREVGDVSIPRDGLGDLRIKMEDGRYQVLNGVRGGMFSGKDNRAGIPWKALKILDTNYPETHLLIEREREIEFPMTYDSTLDAYLPLGEDLNKQGTIR